MVSRRKNKLTSAAGMNLGAIVTRTKGMATHIMHIKGIKIRVEGYLEEFSLSRKEADQLIMSAREIVYK